MTLYISLAVLAVTAFHEFGPWKAALLVAFTWCVMPYRPK